MYSACYDLPQEECEDEIAAMLADLPMTFPPVDAAIVSEAVPEMLRLRMTLKEGRAWEQRRKEQKERERASDRAEAERRSEAKKAETLARLPARKRLEKRAQRERERAARAEEDRAARAEAPIMLAGLDAPQVDEAQLAREASALEAYLARPGHRQGALNGKNGATPADLMATRRVYLAAFAIGNPGYGELAKLFTAEFGRVWSRDQARRRVEKFREFEEPGGPWNW